MRLLVTGGAGFIGSNFVNWWCDQHPEDEVCIVDKITYAGGTPTLTELQSIVGMALEAKDANDGTVIKTLLCILWI